MGRTTAPGPVKLFLAIMYASGTDLSMVLDRLTAAHGPIGHTCGPLAFDYSDYYAREMGTPLEKTYLIFTPLIDRGRLPDIKTATNEFEQEYAREGKRTLNLDPGYLAHDKLVLASTKDFFHRLYLRDGIYGEVTLSYRHGLFRYFSWTYADYREPELHEMLLQARKQLLVQVRELKRGERG